MENARHLDERLRRIIREVSLWTGGEINKNLLHEVEHNIRNILNDHRRNETARFLLLLKDAVDRI